MHNGPIRNGSILLVCGKLPVHTRAHTNVHCGVAWLLTESVTTYAPKMEAMEARVSLVSEVQTEIQSGLGSLQQRMETELKLLIDGNQALHERIEVHGIRLEGLNLQKVTLAEVEARLRAWGSGPARGHDGGLEAPPSPHPVPTRDV